MYIPRSFLRALSNALTGPLPSPTELIILLSTFNDILAFERECSSFFPEIVTSKSSTEKKVGTASKIFFANISKEAPAPSYE